MKKIILFSLFLGFFPLSIMAQDDMYTIVGRPAKQRIIQQEAEATYSGSNRDVDEYNRHGKYWSLYQKIGTDGKGNDVIKFKKGRGIYPDSTYVDATYVGKYYDTITDDDDYRYSSRLSRWDGFYDPWFYSSYYRWRPYSYWGSYYDPWYYGCTGVYDPWYSSWYNPWYNPWYYGYGYGYGYPYYGYYGYGW